jgi:biotin operon repressor
MRRLGVSRQTVWQRVKRGEIEAIHVKNGRKKGLRLKLNCSQPTSSTKHHNKDVI